MAEEGTYTRLPANFQEKDRYVEIPGCLVVQAAYTVLTGKKSSLGSVKVHPLFRRRSIKVAKNENPVVFSVVQFSDEIPGDAARWVKRLCAPLRSRVFVDRVAFLEAVAHPKSLNVAPKRIAEGIKNAGGKQKGVKAEDVQALLHDLRGQAREKKRPRAMDVSVPDLPDELKGGEYLGFFAPAVEGESERSVITPDLVPFLCQGSVDGASDPRSIIDHDIQAIVCVMPKGKPAWKRALDGDGDVGALDGLSAEDIAYLKGVSWHEVVVDDDNLKQTGILLCDHLADVLQLIDDHRLKKRRVYIHCRQGKVRSVCVTLCYLMRCNLTLNEAIARVRLFGRNCRQLIDERQVSFRAVCALVEDKIYRGTGRGGGYEWNQPRAAAVKSGLWK